MELGIWAVVELMGHVKMAGFVSEEELFGAKLGRIDVPPDNDEEVGVTQYFSGQSVYRITPVTEEVARAYARGRQPAPVTLWEIPQLRELHELKRQLQAGETVAHHEDADEFFDEEDYYGADPDF